MVDLPEKLQTWTSTGYSSGYAYESSTYKDAFQVPPYPTIPFEWTWDRTLKSLVLIPIVLGTILGNFLVLFAFCTRGRDLRSPTHFFIANLALADFLVGVLVLPFLATLNITDRWYFGQGFCSAWVCIHFWLCSSSILSTCAVCIERYIGVKFPLKHKSILSYRRISGIIAGVWTLAGCLTLIPIFAWPEPPTNEEYVCKINQQIGHVIVATVGILYIPAIIMIVLYWRIFVIASKHLKTSKKGKHNVGRFSYNSGEGGKTRYDTSGTDATSGIENSSSNSTSTTNDIKKDIKSSNDNNGKKNKVHSGSSDEPLVASSNSKQIMLAKRLAVLVGFLLLSYVPFFTMFLIRAFNPAAVPLTVFIAFGWIRYFNSCVNPLIYAFAVPAYKKALENIVLRCKWYN